MNAAAPMTRPALSLPWDDNGADDLLFRRTMRGMLLPALLLAIAIPLLPVTELIPPADEDAPAHLARVLLEEQALPEPEPLQEPEPKPEPPPVEPSPPEPEPTPPTEIQATPQPAPALNQLAQAQDRARAAGVLAFRDELMDMRDSVDLQQLNQRQNSRGESDATTVERALIAASSRDSGGISNAALSRDAGGPALSAREATRVESDITAGSGANRTPRSQNAETLGGRSNESIRRVMDRNKGALFAVYNRALRSDPLLEGKVVFEMLIAPSGEISELRLISSDLHDEALTSKIIARIRMIRFEAARVQPTKVNYSFDFLPYG